MLRVSACALCLLLQLFLPTHGATTPKPGAQPGGAGGAGADFDLADALDPSKDITNDKKKEPKEGFSDSDLFDVSNDNTYKPDRNKGRQPSDSDKMNQNTDYSGTTEEVGTIAGIASAVVMALVGAVTSYISYQKKKLCFSIQQSLNVDMVSSENPEAVVATEPQVQQTLLEPKAEHPAEAKAV